MTFRHVQTHSADLQSCGLTGLSELTCDAGITYLIDHLSHVVQSCHGTLRGPGGGPSETRMETVKDDVMEEAPPTFYLLYFI